MAKRENNIGNVYAIITSKGYALGQVAGIEESDGIFYCRIFKKLYKEIPKNIEQIISQKEDYVIQIMMPSMTHRKYNMAIKLGKYSLPEWFKKPEYVRTTTAFGGDGSHSPMKYWFIIPAYQPLLDFIGIDNWVIDILKKDLYDESWKEDFKKLNPLGVYNGLGLIEILEKDWSLETWVPKDFNLRSAYLWADYNKG